MRDTTAPDDRAPRHCCACGRETSAAVPVSAIDRVSGPPVLVYACPDDAPHLIPRPTPGELIRRRA
ncbi:hypothetical protein ACIQU6_05660 [Streptomyces sp. NPDC090442]|uniref:hypothetical protein n=1 Tax=Streptomyces sp. NPDC090442 TaxID=3365962 RepID=UPI003826207A